MGIKIVDKRKPEKTDEEKTDDIHYEMLEIIENNGYEFREDKVEKILLGDRGIYPDTFIYKGKKLVGFLQTRWLKPPLPIAMAATDIKLTEILKNFFEKREEAKKYININITLADSLKEVTHQAFIAGWE